MSANFSPPDPWTGRNDPEDGELARRIHHLVADDARRAVLGFACDAGVIRNKGRAGAKEGPAALRKALANMAVPPAALPFTDLGDVVVEGDDLESGQAMLAEKITSGLGNHQRLIVFGGGHETAFGSYSGLHQAFPGKCIGIINLDAHLDLRLIGEQGPSSGTPFTQIKQLNPDRFDYLCIGLAEEANTQALLDRANKWGVKTVFDRDLIADSGAADDQIRAMIERSDLIYLTICLDVLPHYQAPGVSAPAVRGVPLATIEELVRKILNWTATNNCPIPLVDIVELSPKHDVGSVSARTAAAIARRLICL